MAHRIARVNNEIRRELSELIQRHVKDPRIHSFVTVTEVDTTPDLRHSKVYISTIAGQEEEGVIIKVLTAAAGFLRTELARNIRMRHMPELSFHWDNSIEHGDHILRMLDDIAREKQE